MYAQTSKVLVEKVTSGYNATVFAYGATGTDIDTRSVIIEVLFPR